MIALRNIDKIVTTQTVALGRLKITISLWHEHKHLFERPVVVHTRKPCVETLSKILHITLNSNVRGASLHYFGESDDTPTLGQGRGTHRRSHKQ